MEKILIIEDELAIQVSLRDELNNFYNVATASTGNEGIAFAQKDQPDLILLDLFLPDIDGYEVCRTLKTQGSRSTIIMLTARDQLVDKIKGFEAGADDYITKPFSLEEVKARIKAVLRRKNLLPSDTYADSVLNINFAQSRALRKKKTLNLSALEFRLLRYLITRKNEIVTRRELLEQVWQYASNYTTRTVDAHVLLLRRKIGKEYIQTVHKEGYRFETAHP